VRKTGRWARIGVSDRLGFERHVLKQPGQAYPLPLPTIRGTEVDQHLCSRIREKFNISALPRVAAPLN
jgi:hypothetical protein